MSPESNLKPGSIVQRLFSAFPEGWPGVGLVLLRAVMAIPLIDFATGPFASTDPLLLSVQLLTAACSVLLEIGLWTPIAGLLMAVCQVALLSLAPDGESIHIVLAAVGAALAMLGPGAWSMDAHLFGRKRIEIPRR